MATNKKIVGFVDQVDTTGIIGWASNGTNTPLKISVRIDGKVVHTTKANIFRSDVVRAGLHPTGNCGFEIFLNDTNIELSSPCMIHLIAGREQVNLFGSPWPYYSEAYLSEIRAEVTTRTHTAAQKQVLIVGLGKSGTSILACSVVDALPNATLYFEPHGRLGLNHIECHRQATHESRIVTKSLFYKNVPNQFDLIASYYNKRIFIIRDPRDILISTFFYAWNKRDDLPLPLFEQTLAQVLQKEETPQTIAFSALLKNLPAVEQVRLDAFDAFASLVQTHRADWFVLKYEDFIDEKLDDLNNYLDLIVTSESSVPSELNRVERSKKHGNWRNWFTEEDVHYYKPLLADKLAALGYDPDDWTLNQVDTLPASEGSAYMKRVYRYPRLQTKPTLWKRLFSRYTNPPL